MIPLILVLLNGQALIVDPSSADWHCQNDVEIDCTEKGCAATPEGEFTTMHLSFKTSGEFAICAYTGCWAGTGEVVEAGSFLVIWKDDADWYTQNKLDSDHSDVLIAFDRTDYVASIKVAGWAHPMNCSKNDMTPESTETDD